MKWLRKLLMLPPKPRYFYVVSKRVKDETLIGYNTCYVTTYNGLYPAMSFINKETAEEGESLLAVNIIEFKSKEEMNHFGSDKTDEI